MRWLVATPSRQYLSTFFVFGVVSLFNFRLESLIGYQAVALVYLLAVVVMALFFARGPIIFGIALTTLGWASFFAPPRFSFHIDSSYDRMMVVTYFVVGLTISQLATRLRSHREAEIKAKLLVESERLSRTLLNSVSHEFRTPVAAIASAAGELRAAGGLTFSQENLTTEIDVAATRLNRIVQNLLSAARIESGQIRPRPDWCDIADVVRAALGEVKSLKSSHSLVLKIAPGLPLVKIDFVLMEQAIVNLLVNAATHTPDGTLVEVRTWWERSAVILEVADRGPGLHADQLKRIFELFQRGPSAKPGGIGLGLAIVKGFVEAQGCAVRAGNGAQGGAVFTIEIPLHENPELPDENL